MDVFNHPGRPAVCVCCDEEGLRLDEDGACEDCLMPRQHLYGMKRFFVVASDEYRDNLRIQREIASRLRNLISLSEPVNLELANGHAYPVEAEGEFGQIVFRHGWKEFVSANHIEENDSILFVYRGKSRLKVHIFDSSGHEKSSCSQPSSAAFGAVPPCSQIVGPSPSRIIDMSNSDADDDDVVIEGTRESCRGQKRTRSCAETQKMDSISSPSTKSGYGAPKPHDRASVNPEVGSEPLSSNLRAPFRRPYILPKMTILPTQLKEKVEEKVQAIGSELPIFVRVMTATNIGGAAHSPGEMSFGMVYASACLPDKTQPLLLQLEGRKKQWPATLSVTRRNTRRIYDGWKEFATDNQLKAGDICLFEVSSRDSTSLTMTVHLVR
uniref:Uncharacterized protein n=1 Tax=Avena sativa TaxID=4498 RepID=A0ACD5ZBC3_AVESA